MGSRKHILMKLHLELRSAAPRVRRCTGGRLHYMSVASPDEAIDRIRNRVLLGGHNVPEACVRRRFVRSRANLPAAIAGADIAMLYDNSDFDQPYQMVAILKSTT